MGAQDMPCVAKCRHALGLQLHPWACTRSHWQPLAIACAPVGPAAGIAGHAPPWAAKVCGPPGLHTPASEWACQQMLPSMASGGPAQAAPLHGAGAPCTRMAPRAPSGGAHFSRLQWACRCLPACGVPLPGLWLHGCSGGHAPPKARGAPPHGRACLQVQACAPTCPWVQWACVWLPACAPPCRPKATLGNMCWHVLSTK